MLGIFSRTYVHIDFMYIWLNLWRKIYKKCHVSPSSISFLIVFCYWVLEVLRIFWILILYLIWKYFLYSLRCPFAFLIVIFDAQLFLILTKFNFCWLCFIFMKTLTNQISCSYSPVFSSSGFIVLPLTFKY